MPKLGKTKKTQGRAVQRAPLLLQTLPSSEYIVMLNRKTPDTLAIDLTIKGQGEQVKTSIVYFNRTQKQVLEKTNELNASELGKADPEWVNRELFLFVVKEFNGVTPTHEGIIELEDNWPGSVVGIFHKFHDARRVEVVKN
jgi:hypothetical protein